MNRTDRAKSGLENWCQYFDRVVIVDWSSADPVLIPMSMRRKVLLVRVEGQRHFSLTRAYNLAFSYCKSELVHKIDVDYRVDESLFVDVPPGHFRTIDARVRALCGYLCVYKRDFDSVGGYNERMSWYGEDDYDLHRRLEKAGVKKLAMRDPVSGVVHLPHPDRLRIENMPVKSIAESVAMNRESAKVPWGPDSARSSYRVIEGFGDWSVTVKQA